MSRGPLFTVALPVRNGQDFLEQALQSIVTQTYEAFEIVVSDNCSTDRTPDILEAWRKKEPRLRVHRTATLLPPADNFNTVSRLARGTWIKYLCHDDLMHPECLATLKESLAWQDPDSIGLVSNAEEWLFQNGVRHSAPPSQELQRLPGPQVIRNSLLGRGGAIPALTTALVRKTAWESTGGFDSRFLHFDVFCWMRLLLHRDLVFVPQVLTVNRIHGAQIAVGARRSLRSIQDARMFFSRFIDENAHTLSMSRWERGLAKLKAPAMAGSSVAVALLRKEPQTALEIFQQLPRHWWPAVGLLAARAYQTQSKAVSPLKDKVPLEQIYP